MSRILSRALVVVVVFAGAMIGGSRVGRAQQTQPPDVLTALLIEVRGLRAAMEEMASASPRSQLALGRVQLQEQRIANQVRRLDAVMATMAAVRKEIQPLEQHLADLSEPPRDGDLEPDIKRMRQHEQNALRTKLAPMKTEVQRLEVEQHLLIQDIAAEQSRWSDFNQRLEELDRALSRR